MAGSLKHLIVRRFRARERVILAHIDEALDALEFKNEDGIHAARARLYEARSYILR